jgi:predicted molibdopterin-dependent oxidoreductase YjgC
LRITIHPILGLLEERKKITIEIDGQKIEALEGEPIAAALWNAGIRDFRYTRKRKEPRGFFCGIGLCTDCKMIVNGIPNIRTCVTLVEKGMKIQRQRD